MLLPNTSIASYVRNNLRENDSSTKIKTDDHLTIKLRLERSLKFIQKERKC